MSSGHREFLDLIPWYVNGTLGEAERAPLERHLQSCLPCRSALNEERRVERLMRAQPDLPLSPAHGVAGLLERIDARRRPRFGLGTPYWGYAAAAALGGALVWLVFLLSPDPADGPETFTTLSSPGPSAAIRIDVVFAEPPGSDGLERFVAALDGRLVGGPSEIGRYTIALPRLEADALDALLAELRDDPRVRFAGRSFIGDDDGDGDGDGAEGQP